MIHSCKCQKILSGTISLRGWTFSMSDGVMILAIFTCLPLVWHTKASPSCCNSSQRRFMRLCCRAYALLWKLKLFMKSQEKMLFWSEFYVLIPFFLSAQQMSLFSCSLNTPSSSWFTNLTSRTWVTCGDRVTGLCGPSFRFGRVGGPSAFLHYTSLYNACRKISAEESGTKGRVRVSVRAVLCGFCGVTYVFYILIIVLNDCTC